MQFLTKNLECQECMNFYKFNIVAFLKFQKLVMRIMETGRRSVQVLRQLLCACSLL